MMTRRRLLKWLFGGVVAATVDVEAGAEPKGGSVPETESDVWIVEDEYDKTLGAGLWYVNRTEKTISEGQLFVWDEYGDLVPHEVNDDKAIILCRSVSNPTIMFSYKTFGEQDND
jgi:hypothetical protein